MKFLFDLFPIILFFVAFKVWGIFTATAVAIVATLVQIAWVAFRHRKVDPMLWVSLGVVTVFGGATLVLHNDTFIKWKPTVLYWAFSVVLIVSQLAFDKNLIEAMMGKQITLPHAIWGKLSVIWAIFSCCSDCSTCSSRTTTRPTSGSISNCSARQAVWWCLSSDRACGCPST